MSVIHICQTVDPMQLVDFDMQEEYDTQASTERFAKLLQTKYTEFLTEYYPNCNHFVSVVASELDNPHSDFNVTVVNPDDDPEHLRQDLQTELWNIYKDLEADFWTWVEPWD